MHKSTIFYTLCLLSLIAHNTQACDVPSTLQNRIEAYRDKLESFDKDRLSCLYKQLDDINKRYDINTDACILEKLVNKNGDSIFHILAQVGSPRLLIFAQELYCCNLIAQKNRQGKTAIELARTPFIKAILQDAVRKSIESDDIESLIDYEDYQDYLYGDNLSSSESDEDRDLGKLW